MTAAPGASAAAGHLCRSRTLRPTGKSAPSNQLLVACEMARESSLPRTKRDRTKLRERFVLRACLHGRHAQRHRSAADRSSLRYIVFHLTVVPSYGSAFHGDLNVFVMRANETTEQGGNPGGFVFNAAVSANCLFQTRRQTLMLQTKLYSRIQATLWLWILFKHIDFTQPASVVMR